MTRSRNRLKRLTPEMKVQIARTGRFSIPSPAYPDSPHVFQVTSLIQFGVDNLKERLLEVGGGWGVPASRCLDVNPPCDAYLPTSPPPLSLSLSPPHHLWWVRM